MLLSREPTSVLVLEPNAYVRMRYDTCASGQLTALQTTIQGSTTNGTQMMNWNKKNKPSLGTPRARPAARLPTCQVSRSRCSANVQPTSFSRWSFVRAADARAMVMEPLVLARAVPGTRAPKKEQLRGFGSCSAPTLPRDTRPTGSRGNTRQVDSLQSRDSTRRRSAQQYAAPRRPARAGVSRPWRSQTMLADGTRGLCT